MFSEIPNSHTNSIVVLHQRYIEASGTNLPYLNLATQTPSYPPTSPAMSRPQTTGGCRRLAGGRPQSQWAHSKLSSPVCGSVLAKRLRVKDKAIKRPAWVVADDRLCFQLTVEKGLNFSAIYIHVRAWKSVVLCFTHLPFWLRTHADCGYTLSGDAFTNLTAHINEIRSHGCNSDYAHAQTEIHSHL